MDAKGYISFFRYKISDSPGYYSLYFSKNGEQNWQQFFDEHKLSQKDFQAIIVLPFYDVGSEKLWSENDMTSWVSTTGGKASLQLHLPMVDNMSARASLSLAEKQVRLASGPFADKPLFKINNKKAFLLLCSETDSLDEDSKYLLQGADYIGHSFGFFIYACYPERIVSNDKKYAGNVKAILPYLRGKDTCISSSGSWYVDHFDFNESKNLLFGKGAIPCIAGYDTVVANIQIFPERDTQLYEFSCWFLYSYTNANFPSVFLESLDSVGNLMHSQEIIGKTSVDNYGLWFRVSRYFKLSPGCKSIRCKVQNYPNPSYIAMDELLLRPADALIISKDDEGNVMANNHIFKKEN